ncbi:MAG: hypothetical protein H6806_04885 [Planctomycetes bacterium]|nr:hypothetical protein [Planctomycetota bacterium]MCB9829083.1 hypothetical protein [Planctomycetota bacterium]MCB9901197.1 hypothetical protein [Planctomycetota bacterium]
MTALRKAGWGLEEIRARFALAEPGGNPWEWTKAVHQAGRLTAPWDRVVKTWNENGQGCPALPITDKPSAERYAAAGRVWALIVQRTETDDDDLCLACFAAAVRRFAADDWNVNNNQGFDAFAKNPDRWLDEWTAPEVFSPTTYDPSKLPEDHEHHNLWRSS